MENLYCKIQSRLVNLSPIAPQGNALKRINNLSGFICGMIRKGSCHLSDIGSGLPQDINDTSKETAAKRFVENKWTDFDLHYLPYMTAFVCGVLAFSDLNKGIRLVIDGSQAGNHNAVLMISLVWQNRGIPICWYVKSGGKGHFKGQDHEKVLAHAIQIMNTLLADTVEVTVLGDGEFDGIGLQKLCLANGWNYVLRTAKNTVLFEENERFQAKEVSPNSTTDCMFIGQVEFTTDRFKYTNFVCWHDQKRHEDPIYLISNICCVRTIIEYYDQRYSIECLFKDLKSNSFHLHQTRLRKPKEVSNLILIAALAFLFLTVLAIHYDEPKWRKKVQRVRNDRKVRSFFTFAYKLLEHLLQYGKSINFSFQFSKNSALFIQEAPD